MTREQRIKRGLIWQVFLLTQGDSPPLFEGTKAAAVQYFDRQPKHLKNLLRLGKLLWESKPPPTLAGEMFKILDLPINDAGERVIPPGFLDNARELLKNL